MVNKVIWALLYFCVKPIEEPVINPDREDLAVDSEKLRFNHEKRSIKNDVSHGQTMRVERSDTIKLKLKVKVPNLASRNYC